MNRNQLLQSDVPLYLTDGGIETTLMFHDGFELPEFAVFPLLDTAHGRQRLSAYYERYIKIALRCKTGFILEAPTWRASRKWAKRLGYGDVAMCRVNAEAIRFMAQLRMRHATRSSPMLISGCVGPQDDGYEPDQLMLPQCAESYHLAQVQAFQRARVDLVTAITMTYPDEAVGIANAAASMGLPVVISFTVETDGRLPTGISLQEAIAQVDRQAKVPPVYYMINCAHPDHFNLSGGESWLQRIGGIRANASRMSHAELDESETLDDGDPTEFGEQHRALGELLPNLKVIGGCCGTDHRHIAAVAKRVAPCHTVSQATRSMRLSDLWQKPLPRPQKSPS